LSQALEKRKAQELRKTRWWHNLCQTSKCYYCSLQLTPEIATMDHIIPISSGGKSTRGNVVACCKECNNRKKDKSVIDFVLENGGEILRSAQDDG
jgi:5-methylcytosine-specific restriction enzyme A